jgi:hypothetical protein
MPTRTDEDVRREIAAERERLATAVGALRGEMSEAADIAGRLRSKLPLVAAAAVGAGFFLAGGIGATARLIFRRGRE